MLAFFRIIFMALFIILSCVFGLLLCIVKPFHTNNVHIISGWFCKVAKILGVKLELKYHDDPKNIGPAVYVANHQNNYDLFTLPAMVPENCVSLGKKKP